MIKEKEGPSTADKKKKQNGRTHLVGQLGQAAWAWTSACRIRQWGRVGEKDGMGHQSRGHGQYLDSVWATRTWESSVAKRE